MQLVVQRANTLGDGHVLRDARQVAPMLLGAIERVGERCWPRPSRRPAADHGHEPAGQERAGDLADTVLARRDGLG